MENEFRRREANEGVLRRLFAHINSRDFDAALELLGDEFVWEMPYAPPALPAPFDRKRAEKLLRGFPSVFAQGLTFHDVDITRMRDADCFLAEYRGEAVMAATGQPYRNRYVAIFKLANQRIIAWREYFDSAEANRAFGWAPR